MKTSDLADPADHNEQQREYFEASDHTTLKRTGSPYLRRHVDRIMQYTGMKPGDRVLEVGCGLGRYTLILAELGIKVEGLDLSPRLLERLAEIAEGKYDVPLHAMDLVDAPSLLDGAYDHVVGFFVLHHVHDVTSCLRRATELIKPSGRVAFIEPNPLNPLFYPQIFFTPEMRWRNERGMLKMRPLILQEAMRLAGLTEIGFSRFGFLPPFLTNMPYGTRVESLLESIGLWRSFLPFQIFGGARPKPSVTRVEFPRT